MRVSLGLGLTNACNLACPHCYRPEPPLEYLPLETVRRVCEAFDVAGVNLGTGENALHPEFRGIVDFLLARGLRVSLASNGLSLRELPDEVLRGLHDAEVSIDFPDRERFDALRGPGAWEMAVGALERCRALGVRTTVLAVLMRANHRDLASLARLAAELCAPLRVNVYQPVRSLAFAPTYEEFWWAIRDLLEHATLLACSERVVCAAAGLPSDGLRCGRTSLRITPSGGLLPCVYWPSPVGEAEDAARIGDRVFEWPSFECLGRTPSACLGCDLLARCGGGCASRRVLAAGSLDEPDPYCPKRGDVDLRRLVSSGAAGERLHTGNVCTLLVRA